MDIDVAKVGDRVIYNSKSGIIEELTYGKSYIVDHVSYNIIYIINDVGIYRSYNIFWFDEDISYNRNRVIDGILE